MIVAIHQPNYLPWCGYFAKIKASETFIFLDDAQLSKQSYTTRTRIRSGDADRWLSLPVCSGGSPLIKDVRFSDAFWPRKHLKGLEAEYRRAPCYLEVMDMLAPIYELDADHLALFNERLVRTVSEYLGLNTEFRRSSEFDLELTGDDRLIDLVRAAGGNTYLSGPGGDNYQNHAKFSDANLEIVVREYSPRPYEAPKFPFHSGLSIVDALFILGRKTLELI